MTQTELIAVLAERAQLPKSSVQRVLQSLGDVANECTARGEDVHIARVGTLTCTWRRRTVIRDVREGRRMLLGARYAPAFRPAAELKRSASGRTSQLWQDPAHQAAWRLAETLLGDVDLYHASQAPGLRAEMTPADIRQACASAFGPVWTRVVETYFAATPDAVRREHDYLADIARDLWTRA